MVPPAPPTPASTGRPRSRVAISSRAPPHPGSREPAEGDGSAAGIEEESNRGNEDAGGYAAPSAYALPYVKALPTRPNVTTDLHMSGHVKGLFSDPRVPPTAGYYGALTALDHEFGRLMKTLEDEGLRDDTIVVFTSDHGEMLYSHGLFGKHVWWEEAIGIPFMVAWPKAVRPGRCEALVNQPDFMPTLLGLAGCAIPGNVEGTDFSPVLRGGAGPGSEASYSAIFNNNGALDASAGWRCIRTKKYCYAVELEKAPKAKKNKGTSKAQTRELSRALYDMEADPYQLKPLDAAAGRNPVARELAGQLRAWLEKKKDPFSRLV